MISLGVGAFMFAISVAKDAKNNLNAINESAKIHENQKKILKQLAGYVQFHSFVKRFSNRSYYLRNSQLSYNARKPISQKC